VGALKLPHLAKQIKDVMTRIGGISPNDESQLFNVLQSLLWLPCTDSCPDCIEKRHKYQELTKPSRALLLSLLDPYAQHISYGQSDWKEQLQRELSSNYVVQVRCAQEQLPFCTQDLHDVLIEPIEEGFQFFYPVIERITRVGLWWTIEIRVREFAHV
jgi:hypothetical protein